MKTLKGIGFHIIIWGIILSINLTFFGGYFGHDPDMYKLFLVFNAPIWGIYVILFYTNYLVYIPKLLFSNNIIAYIFCTVVTLGLSYVAIQEFKYSAVASKMKQEFPQVNQRNTKGNTKNKQKQSDVDQYGKSPLLTSVQKNSNRNRITSSADEAMVSHKNDYILLEDVYHKRDTKRHMYGDVVYFSNETSGIRSLRRYHNDEIYNFRDPRNITQIYILLLIFAISLGVGAVEKSAQRSRDISRITSEKLSSEISFLKQQINPHFLFNALNSIYSLVLPHSEQASDAVIKLSSILRYMLYETDKAQVSLEKEMEVINDYLALQKFKFNDITKVNFNIKGDIQGYTIEPLLLITFVENAFKYGADNITPSFIKIDVSVDNGSFVMSVENKVVVVKSNDENSGIGIKNIKRRLDLMYKENYNLDIEQKDDIFSIKLKLKLL